MCVSRPATRASAADAAAESEAGTAASIAERRASSRVTFGSAASHEGARAGSPERESWSPAASALAPPVLPAKRSTAKGSTAGAGSASSALMVFASVFIGRRRPPLPGA